MSITKAIGDRAEQDARGWFTYPDNPISKEGVFPYSGKLLMEAGMTGLEPDTLYPVYRPASELDNPTTIESFKLVPWIVGHTHLGAGATPADAVPVGGVVGEDVYFKDGTLYGNLRVFGEQHKAVIANGVKELSIGYSARFEKEDGEWQGERYMFVQRDIIGNHLASVSDGRAGPSVRVQDSIEIQKGTAMDEELKARIESLEKGHADILAALNVVMEQLKAKAGDTEEDKPTGDTEDTSKPTGDTEETKPTGDTEETKPAGDTEDTTKSTGDTEEKLEEKVTAAVGDALPKVLQALRRRDALAQEVTPLVGVFDHADMTEGQVAAYAVKKLQLKIAATPDSLRAYLAGAKAAAPVTHTHVGDSREGAGATPAFLKSLIGG